MAADTRIGADVPEAPEQAEHASMAAVLTHPLGMLVSPRTWVAAIFLVLSFAVGLFWFVALVTLVSTGAALAITLVGLPILALTLILWTYGARAERWRVRVMLGTEIASPYRPGIEGSMFARFRHFATDPAVWRDFIYLALLFPIGLAEFVIAVVAVSMPFWALALPTYIWAAPGAGPEFGSWRLNTEWEALLVALGGFVLLLIVPYLLVGLARAHAYYARFLLGPTQRDLSRRVATLSSSRTRVIDAALQERRRIERDLHDGVQQHLTALALDLGLAREKMETDPAAANALVTSAHEAAKATLGELRDLVRGIAPAILADRGLDAAVSALAARSPVPVTVDVSLTERPPEAVEMTAYFIVAEALTNVARHSGATAAHISVRDPADGPGRTLIVEVRDNGHGGADAARGTGLRGLADRVAGVDGTLTLTSPAGGPTVVRAELPCAS